jgi:hypothetical protein
LLPYLGTFERIITRTLLVLMTGVVLLATVELVWVLGKDVVTPPLFLLELDELLELFGQFLLVLVEVTDLIFAVDSIPAIFAVTSDPFIVFTSNIFAILGLRAMYFLLVDMAERFHLLKYGLAVILMFIGAKMLLLDFYKIPVGIALGIVGLILLVSVAASLVISRPSGPAAENKH